MREGYFIHATLNGKRICYTDDTEFLVQTGKGRSEYRTQWRFVGQLERALIHYNGINVGNGYKKRLLVPSFNKPVLARELT